MSTITTTISQGITLSGSGSYTSPLTVASSGYIDDTGSGTAIVGSDSATVLNYGRIVGPQGGIGLGSAGVVLNDGTISAETIGVSIDSAGTVWNAGTIEATGASTVGVFLVTGGNLLNTSTGLITGGMRITQQPGTLADFGIIEGLSLSTAALCSMPPVP